MQLQELNIRAFLPKNVASVTAGAPNVNFGKYPFGRRFEI